MVATILEKNSPLAPVAIRSRESQVAPKKWLDILIERLFLYRFDPSAISDWVAVSLKREEEGVSSVTIV